MQAFKRAGNMQKHAVEEIFTDVYAGEEPWNIVRDIARYSSLSISVCLFHRKSSGRNCVHYSRNMGIPGNLGRTSSRDIRVKGKGSWREAAEIDLTTR